MLSYNDELHEYRFNGLLVPSVTQVISESCPFPWHNDAVARAAAFGKALHKTIELKEKNELGEYDPIFAGYLEQVDEAKEFLLKKLKGVIVIDWKSGQYNNTWSLQTAGYQRLYENNPNGEVIEGIFYSPLGFAGTLDRVLINGKGKIHRVCIQLTENSFKPHFPTATFAEDFNVFLSMLNTYRWKMQNKMIKKDGKNGK